MKKIAILGAGINGISTALAILENIKNVEVTVISEKFSPNTTSDVAAGLIEPYLCEDDEEKIIKWTKSTISRIQEYQNEGNEGAEEMSGYWLQSVKQTPKWLRIMKNVNILSEDEVRKMARRPEHKFGIFYTTWYLEPTRYIKWSTQRFLKNGGKLKIQKIENLIDDVTGYDVIVNCCGLGSRKLVGDLAMVPVRGQILKVECPQVKHFFIDDFYYCLLNDSTITLGGTADVNQWDLTIDPKISQKIFEENCQNVPSLKNSKILSSHVDLRPSRPTVRLEIDREFGKIPIIHNYGHGGSGITLHWGCALECVELVENLISTDNISCKL